MSLLAFQENFAKAVRQPEGSPLPWTTPVLDKPERMAVYQELVFNNIKTFVDACFPVASACLGEGPWLALNQAFVAQHRCTTPFFREIPAEFVAWVETLYSPSEDHEDALLAGADLAQSLLVQNLNLPDYLPHLLHYEWLELCVQVHANQCWQREVQAQQPIDGCVATLKLILNPTLKLACYPYAVQCIAPGQVVDKHPTFLMVWRNACFTVQFAQLQVASYLLLESITLLCAEGKPIPVQTLAQQLAKDLGTSVETSMVWQELQRLQGLGVLEIGVV